MFYEAAEKMATIYLFIKKLPFLERFLKGHSSVMAHSTDAFFKKD